jgi:hypothetical protein
MITKTFKLTSQIIEKVEGTTDKRSTRRYGPVKFICYYTLDKNGKRIKGVYSSDEMYMCITKKDGKYIECYMDIPNSDTFDFGVDDDDMCVGSIYVKGNTLIWKGLDILPPS